MIPRVCKRAMLVIVGFSATWLGATACAETTKAKGVVDLSKAVILVSDANPIVQKAGKMLSEEAGKRAGLSLPCVTSRPSDPAAVIKIVVAGSGEAPAGLDVPAKAEGFAIQVDAQPGRTPSVLLVGRDPRGAVFAAGRLLRLMHYGKGTLSVDEDVKLSTAPRFSLRGHQLGYRETPNAYDAWDVATYEQYVRDMILFGTNSVEFTTTLDKEEKPGPNMAKSTWDMTSDLAKMLKEYDVLCWTWQELPEIDIAKPETAKKLYAQFRELFKTMDGFDNLFVPGGDGGIAPARDLMPFLEGLAPILHEIHPDAKLWVSNQTFSKEENDYVFDLLQKQQPKWLDGVVYGPWTKLGPDEMRKRTAANYPLRLYPDITHNVRCQYPVPNWDRAFAHGLNREAPNPRPVDMQIIFKRYASLVGDSVSYSEGVNDDLNKFVWSALGWDPETPLQDILFDYGKVFFGDSEAETVAKGLRMLEENWRGPIASNKGIKKTLKLWQGVDKRAKAAGAAPNWRLQMYLMRAYYDVYLQKKAKAETRYEAQAYAALKQAARMGAEKAIEKARATLAQAGAKPAAPECRAEIVRLAGELRKSIGMQLSIKPPFYASGAERGSVLDTLDTPMNNRAWLDKEFKGILDMKGDAERLARINAIVTWENPGPGNYYDDLGNPTKQPHLVVPLKYADDPGFVDSVQCEYSFGLDGKTLAPSDKRLSWLDQAQTLYGQPLRMHYDGLDPKASYRVRVTYAGRFATTMRLVANKDVEIHPWRPQPAACAPAEFDIPQAATQGGALDLEWQLSSEMSKALPFRPMARGCQVAEVWLLKK